MAPRTPVEEVLAGDLGARCSACDGSGWTTTSSSSAAIRSSPSRSWPGRARPACASPCGRSSSTRPWPSSPATPRPRRPPAPPRPSRDRWRARCRSPRSSAGSSSRASRIPTTSTRPSCWSRASPSPPPPWSAPWPPSWSTTTPCACGSIARRTAGGRRTRAAEPVTPFHRVDLSGLPAARRGEAFERAAAALQAGFDLAAGPLTRLCLFETGAGQPARLLWVTHHLVVDGVSWRVLLEDLEAAYRQAARGLRPACRPRPRRSRSGRAAWPGTPARRRWPASWSTGARPPGLPCPACRWTSPAATRTSSATRPRSPSSSAPKRPRTCSRPCRRSTTAASTTRCSAPWCGPWRAGPARRACGWTSKGTAASRSGDVDDLDVSRTVGWFTSLYPVVLEAGDAGPGEALVSAKERLRAVPGRGIGYGLLRHLGDGGAASWQRLRGRDPASTIWASSTPPPASALSSGPPRPPPAPAGARAPTAPTCWRSAASWPSGRLRITLTYGSRTHRRETAERLAAAYAGALRELIQHSRESDEVFTPSDFPKAGLDAAQLRQAGALSRRSGGRRLKNVEDIYPLSPLQNGMLFHSLMAPESGVYVTQVTCTLPADLDARLFRQAWETLVERHAVLRTAFLWEGLDEPLQVVRKSVSLPWQELDWRGLPAEEQQRRFEELRQRERHTPLPLASAPLMRFSLVRLDARARLRLDLPPPAAGRLVAAPPGPGAGSRLRGSAGGPGAGAAAGRGRSATTSSGCRGRICRGRSRSGAGSSRGSPPPTRSASTARRAAAAAAGYAEHRLRLSREVTAEPPGPGGAAQADPADRHPRRLGRARQPLQRRGGRGLRQRGLRPSGRPARCRDHGRHVHQHPAGAGAGGRRRAAGPLAAAPPGAPARPAGARAHARWRRSSAGARCPAGSPLFETLYVFENYPDAGRRRLRRPARSATCAASRAPTTPSP